MALVPVPGNPGVLRDDTTGKEHLLTDLREDDLYDTVEFASGSLTDGISDTPFSAVTTKKLQHTNLTKNGQIPGLSRAFVQRIGVHVRQFLGNTACTFADTMRVVENGAITFKINTDLIAEGPLLKFQSGYGVAGVTTETDSTALSIGVPSHAAAPKFIAAQGLSDKDDLSCKIEFPDASWSSGPGDTQPSLTNATAITVFLRCLLERPAIHRSIS